VSTPEDDRQGGRPFNVFISDWEEAPASLPPDVSAWAIGDVHGYLEHLEALLGAVERQAATAPPGPKHLVIIGDTIDRGPDNIAALERPGAIDIPGVTVTALWGNHEEFLDRFLHDEDVDEGFLEFWAANGGLATLANLGISPGELRRREAREIISQVRASTPRSVDQALGRLRRSLRLGGYLFVHAGVHPLYPLADEEHQRLTTIREPFLSGKGWIHDFAVVHGHSIVGPDIAPHRIAVDSGAYYTGVLSCVELRGARARFIAVTRDESLDALLKIRGRRPLSAETWRRLR
jgi:serine/threonine protein phosphatase 1